jgi:hypothetical protein
MPKPTANRTVEYVPLGDIRSNPNNPKEHDDELIQESVGRFGFVEPMVRDERTGFLISGHGRAAALKAAWQRGETPPDGVQLGEAGVWLAPVVVGWSSANDAEASAALIALNRTTELGGWADDSLLDLLEQISADGGSLLGVGFDDEDLDDLRARLQEMEQDAPDETDANTRITPSMTDYADKYDEQGRRLIVLDYDKDDYPQVTARLKLLRAQTGTESNADALMAHLLQVLPDLSDEELEAEAEEGGGTVFA